MGTRLKIEIDHQRLDVIANKLLHISGDSSKLPHILTIPRRVFTLITNSYLILAVLDQDGIDRIEKYSSEGNHPFPGLIAPDIKSIKYGFNLDKAKNAIFNNTKVVNRFSFNIGTNSTAIICGHKVLIDSEVFGRFDYDIDLMYLISFGDEINNKNVYDYLDELVEFSFIYWRSAVV